MMMMALQRPLRSWVYCRKGEDDGLIIATLRRTRYASSSLGCGAW
jgi:hypothetical protein